MVHFQYEVCLGFIRDLDRQEALDPSPLEGSWRGVMGSWLYD